jgi:hypothetical protein
MTVTRGAEVPPSSTTAVAIKPIGPRNVEFLCGVPGHREAGMVGTLSVEWMFLRSVTPARTGGKWRW